MPKRYYPKSRAPRLETKQADNHEAWVKIHHELAELMFMLHYTRSKDQYLRVSYGGTLKQLEKHCRKIINIISAYEENKDG